MNYQELQKIQEESTEQVLPQLLYFYGSGRNQK